VSQLRGIPPEGVVLAAGVATALHLGKLPPAVPVLQGELGMTLVQAGWLLSLVQFAAMCLGLVIGMVADGFGPKRSMVLGLTVLSGAGVASGFTHDVAGLLGLRVLEGLGLLLSVVPAPDLLRRSVPAAGLTRALGAWGAYVPVGTAIGMLVGPRVLVAASWPVWWWVVAGTTAVMALAVLVWVPADPRRPPGAAPVRWQARARHTVTARGPWLGALAFCVYAAQWMAVIGFLPTLYAASGWVGATGAVLTALVTLGNAAGNIGAGLLSHRGWSATRLLVWGFGGQAIGTALAFMPVFAPWPPLRVAGALAFSTLGGLVPGTLFGLAPRLAPSAETVSTTVGFIQQWSSAGQVVGPPIAAAVAGLVGGWQWTWALSLACCLAGIALALRIRTRLAPPRHATVRR